MDDTERQSAQANAQQEREKGAALEYDAQDDNALQTPAPGSEQNNLPHHEEK